jgi:sigma-E factor negative regulatory protein RseA
MTNSMDERISALMDGELDESTRRVTADELLKKDEARSTWARYHLISDTLRQNLPAGMDSQFSSRVMAALDAEPTVLAPSVQQASPLTRRLAGFAVAASVAAVAVMGVQFMYQQDVQLPAEQMAQAPNTLSPSNVSPNALSTNQAFARAQIQQNIQTVTQTMGPTTGNPSNTQQQTSPLAQRFHPNLNRYLVDHNQQAARLAVQGAMPYARIVAQPNTHYIVIPVQK